MQYLLALWIGKILQLASRLSGRGRGSALPGLVALRVYPEFLEQAAERLDSSVIITGTNGKTTTAKMLRTISEAAGYRVVANRAGSNLPRGIASTVIEHSGASGKLPANLGIFEVDEAFVEPVASVFKPQSIVVLNLLRDQLDRYHELDRAAQLVKDGFQYAETVVLNQDDPLVAGLAEAAADVVYFGASEKIRKNVPHDAALYGQVSEDLPKPAAGRRTVMLSEVEAQGSQQRITFEVNGKTYDLNLQLPGIYNAYNAVAAAGVAVSLGLDLAQVTHSLGQVTAAFGRTERIEIDGKSLQLLLVKNPAGFNQVIANFLVGKGSRPVLVAINDQIADGRDVSWLWDVNIEKLVGESHQIITSGIRGSDMALRLKYADINCENNNDLSSAIGRLLELTPAGETGYIIPTYTALLQIRKILAKKTDVEPMGGR